MSTERWLQIVCDVCGERTESVSPSELSESEYRADLKKRFGWVSWKTDRRGEHKDVCPACQATSKGGNQ
jgi:hypothetical protein